MTDIMHSKGMGQRCDAPDLIHQTGESPANAIRLGDDVDNHGAGPRGPAAGYKTIECAALPTIRFQPVRGFP